MNGTRVVRRAGTVLGETLPLGARDRLWLGLALLPAAVAVTVYLATNPYPAYGAGLYTQFAKGIVANGYRPPVRVPGYTVDGVPFAYPPLQFYLFAVLLDLGGDPVVLSRFLPGVAVLAVQVPTYLLGRDAIDSRPAGVAAATLVALHPQVLQWHISAGGIVRAFAFLYAMTAIYAGYRVFTTGSRRAVVLGVLAFGLTVLSHPTYTLFVVVSYLLFWAVCDRSFAGLRRGAAVGVGGAVLASPWLVWVTGSFGATVLTAAAGTHGGVGGGVDVLVGEMSRYTTLLLLAAAYLLAARREVLLPAWVGSAELLFKQPRFAYVAGAFVLAAAAVDLGRQLSLHGRLVRLGSDIYAHRAVAASVLVTIANVGGGVYLVHEMTDGTDSTTPEFLDDDAVAAMEWVEADAPADATFVVIGDAAEWFPALTDRTITVAPWGVEWVSAGEFERQLAAFENVSACQDVTCVETISSTVGPPPEYVYVPKGQYTIRGDHAVQSGAIERSFQRSPDWDPVFENDGVVVYRRVTATEGGAGDDSTEFGRTSTRRGRVTPA